MTLLNALLPSFAPQQTELCNKKPSRKLIYCLAGIALFFLLSLLSGCGTSQTDMRMDKDFSGERSIQVSMPSWGLERVRGGQAAVEDLIKQNMPKALTYSAKATDGTTTFSFNLLFDSVVDYRQKIETLLEANPGNTISPLVILENGNSPFKKGFAMRENFASADLLGWLVYSFDEAEILGQKVDVSAYITFADTVVRYGGKEYTAPGDEPLEIDDMQKLAFESITTHTRMLWDGGFERTFSFHLLQSTFSELQNSGVDVQQYLQASLPANATLTSAPSFEDDMIYTIVLTAASQEELVQATNAILQTSNNSFSLQVMPYENGKAAKIVVDEYLNGSHFLDYAFYYSSPMVSNLQPLPGCTPTHSSAELPTRLENTDSTVFFAHSIPLDTAVQTEFAWDFQFQALELQFTLGKGILAQLHFKLPYNTAPHIADIASQHLSSAISGNLSLSSQKNKANDSYIFTLSTGNANGKELSAMLNDFATKYSQNFTKASDGDAFRIAYAQAQDSSLFQPHYTFSAVCDAQIFATHNSTQIQISPAVGYTLGNAPAVSSTSESAQLGSGVFATRADVFGLNWLLIILPLAFVLAIGAILLNKMLATRPKKNTTKP